jgi:hypothetical protein
MASKADLFNGLCSVIAAFEVEKEVSGPEVHLSCGLYDELRDDDRYTHFGPAEDIEGGVRFMARFLGCKIIRDEALPVGTPMTLVIGPSTLLGTRHGWARLADVGSTHE